MGNSALNPMQDAIGKVIIQNGHNFAVGDMLRKTLGGYAKALATTQENAEVCGAVMEVISVDKFRMCIEGHISIPTANFTADTVYWLSETDVGQVTEVQPTTPGNIQKPCLWAISATEALFLNMRGLVIPDGTGGGGGTTSPANELYYGTLTKGSSNDFSSTITDFPDHYPVGVPLFLRSADYNEAGGTLSINGLDPVPLIKRNTVGGEALPLAPKDLCPDGVAQFIYDGVNMQMLTQWKKMFFPGSMTNTGSNAYSATISDFPTTPYEGATFLLKAYGNNSGASTLSVNGSTPFPIVKVDTLNRVMTNVATNDIVNGWVYQITYSGSAFQVHVAGNQVNITNVVTEAGGNIFFGDMQRDAIDTVAYTASIQNYPTEYMTGIFHVLRVDIPYELTENFGQEVTLNINNIGPVNIRKRDTVTDRSSRLGDNDFATGMNITMMYDGTEFVVLTNENNKIYITEGFADAPGTGYIWAHMNDYQTPVFGEMYYDPNTLVILHISSQMAGTTMDGTIVFKINGIGLGHAVYRTWDSNSHTGQLAQLSDFKAGAAVALKFCTENGLPDGPHPRWMLVSARHDPYIQVYSIDPTACGLRLSPWDNSTEDPWGIGDYSNCSLLVSPAVSNLAAVWDMYENRWRLAQRTSHSPAFPSIPSGESIYDVGLVWLRDPDRIEAFCIPWYLNYGGHLSPMRGERDGVAMMPWRNAETDPWIDNICKYLGTVYFADGVCKWDPSGRYIANKYNRTMVPLSTPAPQDFGSGYGGTDWTVFSNTGIEVLTVFPEETIELLASCGNDSSWNTSVLYVDLGITANYSTSGANEAQQPAGFANWRGGTGHQLSARLVDKQRHYGLSRFDVIGRRNGGDVTWHQLRMVGFMNM